MKSNVAKLAALMVLVVCATGALAEDAKFSVILHDNDSKPVANGAVKVVPLGQAEIALTTDATGRASCKVPRTVLFSCAISASGFGPLNIHRTLGKNDDWGTARIIMNPPRLGVSRVAEWRVGRSNDDAEDPARDFARFNFHVKYYRDNSKIAGATITLTKKDGTLFKTLTTDANGFATVLVTEGTVLAVKVSASGYADYSTGLAPGMRATSRDVAIRLRKS